MRIVLAVLLLITLASPAVLAEGDPSFSLPDASPLAAQALGTPGPLVDDAIATWHANIENVAHSVNDAQLLTTPFSRLTEAITADAAFGVRVVGAASSLGGAVLGFAATAAEAKIDETSFVSEAADQTGATALTASGSVAEAALTVACHGSVSVPPHCDDASLVGQGANGALGVVDSAVGFLQTPQGEQVQDALEAIVDELVG